MINHNSLVKTEKITCPICNSEKMSPFFYLENVPINSNRLWDNQKEAVNCPKGDIKLTFCHNCGLITNIAFKGDIVYDSEYENSLFYSASFRDFAESLTKKIIKKYALNQKQIIEISYGKSNFLELFCTLGNNNGINFDPTHQEKLGKDEFESKIKIIPSLYSNKYSNYQADFIFSWHVLEHTSNPKELILNIRETLTNNKDIHIFFGVPNGMDNFRKLFVWDIIYEHYTYFTPPSLTYLFETNGFKVEELAEEHHGQSLCLVATPKKHIFQELSSIMITEIEQIWEDIISFSDKYSKKIDECDCQIKSLLGPSQIAIIWGAGSRGVTFLNTLKTTQIEYAVDINPRKQGKYIPGTGQKIIAPESLRLIKPDLVIVMNPIYEDEIKQNLKNLGLNPKIISV